MFVLSCITELNLDVRYLDTIVVVELISSVINEVRFT